MSDPVTAAPIFTVDKFFDETIAVAYLITCEIGAFQQSVALESARHADESRRSHAFGHRIRAGPQHFTADRDLRSIHLVASEDPDGIEWTQVDIGISDQHIGNVEVDGLRMQIGRNEPDNLSMGCGLRQHVLDSCGAHR